jgi:hypothetical protein
MKKRIFVELTPELHVKLKVYLAKNGMTLRRWIELQIEKIEEKSEAKK